VQNDDGGEQLHDMAEGEMAMCIRVLMMIVL
jgi:hypothetical protein